MSGIHLKQIKRRDTCRPVTKTTRTSGGSYLFMGIVVPTGYLLIIKQCDDWAWVTPSPIQALTGPKACFPLVLTGKSYTRFLRYKAFGKI